MGQFTQVERFGGGGQPQVLPDARQRHLRFVLALMLGAALLLGGAVIRHELDRENEFLRQKVASLELTTWWQPQDSRTVWFATSRDGETRGLVDLYRLDTTRGRCERILTRPATGKWEFSVAPNGEWVAVSVTDGSLDEGARLDVVCLRTGRTWSQPLVAPELGQGGRGAVWSADSRWVSRSSCPADLLFDTVALAWAPAPEAPTSRVRWCASRGLWTLDGSRRLHADGAGAWLETPAGERASAVIHPPQGDHCVSPDGKGVYVMVQHGCYDAQLAYVAFDGGVKMVGTMALWTDPLGLRRTKSQGR